MRKITLISAYYENPNMLKKQLENIASYSQEVKDNLEVIFIDDGSPDNPAKIDIETGVKTSLYRTLVDVRWNQDFCRNLGVNQAANPYLFLTDIDHLVPNDTLLHLMTDKFIYDFVAYRFGRVTAPSMEKYKMHPNTWFMYKDIYNKAGGYDEALAGHYGTDGDFAKRVMTVAAVIPLTQFVIRVPREYIPDASTTRYERKNEDDPDRKKRITRERESTPNWRPKNLSFPWEKVC